VSEAFLSHLTVFKSRLGLATLDLRTTSTSQQPTAALVRKLRRLIEVRDDLPVRDPSSWAIFEYLLEKKLIGRDGRSGGRYKGIGLSKRNGQWVAVRSDGREAESIPVFRVDQWLAAPDVRSTIGAPTPDNAEEALELGYQLRLISSTRNSWTAAGYTARQLRGLIAPEPENPFVLQCEAPALLRQILAVDGVMLREVLRDVVDSGTRISRDEVALRFDRTVSRALGVLKELAVPPPELRKARDFEDLIRKTVEKRATMSTAPGVLEHRVSPRLEWLADLGYLSKEGLPKNGFQYLVEDSAMRLMRAIDESIGSEFWADDVALAEWEANPLWATRRRRAVEFGGDNRFIAAYRLLQPRIGPVALREMAFTSGVLSPMRTTAPTERELIVDFARSTSGVSLSGGRYNRSPENVYVAKPERLS
jgi:hypothetical protein